MTEQIMFFAFGFIGATLIALLVLIAMRRRTARPVMQHPEAEAPVSAAQNEAGDNTRSSELEQAAHKIESGIGRLKQEIAAAKARIADARKEDSPADEAINTGQAGTQAVDIDALFSGFDREAETLAAAFEEMKEKVRSQADARERELLAAAGRRQSEATERARAEVQSLRDELRSKTEAFQATVEILREEKSQLQHEFAQLRDERDLLLSESASLRAQLQDSRAEERMENAVLREHVSDIAAEVARLAINLEGINSPIERLIATGAQSIAHEAGSPADDETRDSLAERIRKLQIRS
jgi:chromosome segregation ATPase